jgi:hypothetical protein
MQHRGVAVDDPRNAGPIAFFAPKKATRESLRHRLTVVMRGKSPADVDAAVDRVLDKIARGPIRPDPPVSQSLGEVADPWYGLGTHPDIIEIMWKLDDELPRRCRWVFWGCPALVHPDTGVVFAVGMGTIGHVIRLPPHVLETADPRHARIVVSGNPGQTFDIGPAGPEWRFVSAHAREAEWCRLAYEFAGVLRDASAGSSSNVGKNGAN